MTRRYSTDVYGSSLRTTPKSGSNRRSSGLFGMTSTPKESTLSDKGSPIYSATHDSFDYPSIIAANRNSSRLYKVIVIGEVATGKSALIKRYVHNFFGSKAHYRATLGVDFQLKMLKFNDEMDIRLQLWDIAGQERFSSMTRAYYKGSVGAVVVFDNSDARTFHAAMERWKPDLDGKIRLPGSGDKKLPVLLICNKTDLPRDPKLPNDYDISKMVNDKGFIPKWIKTSAKTGEGVNDAFNIIVRYILAMDTWNEPMVDPDFSLDSSIDSSFNRTDTVFNQQDDEDCVSVTAETGPKKGSYCIC